MCVWSGALWWFVYLCAGIETLRANVSALEQRVMDLNNSLNSDPKNDLNVVCEGGECCVHTYTD